MRPARFGIRARGRPSPPCRGHCALPLACPWNATCPLHLWDSCPRARSREGPGTWGRRRTRRRSPRTRRSCRGPAGKRSRSPSLRLSRPGVSCRQSPRYSRRLWPRPHEVVSHPPTSRRVLYEASPSSPPPAWHQNCLLPICFCGQETLVCSPGHKVLAPQPSWVGENGLSVFPFKHRSHCLVVYFEHPPTGPVAPDLKP